MTTVTEVWLRRHQPRPAPAFRLVCLPHAGGAASSFREWGAQLPDSVELSAVQYPGREDRVNEPFATGIPELAGSIALALRPLADCPLVLFGHGLGALVAYEVARVLQAAYGVHIDHLVVSGRRAPSLAVPGVVHKRPDQAVIDEISRLSGTSAELLRDYAFRRFFLAAIRSDFRLAETYRAEPGPKLTCPLTSVIGCDDIEVDAFQASCWSDHTTGPFTFRSLPGGHFYLLQDQEAVLHLLSICFAQRSNCVSG
ncbi:thioesterase II family protein [Streptomyces lydicus]|uniref:thioesterase II family protein n=1 Tax=Streptomyces lydicus TaxID=47763 RepID=UPI0036E4BAFD